MAITKCSECSGEISDKALACPHCGNPLRTENTPQLNELENIGTSVGDKTSLRRSISNFIAISIAIVAILFFAFVILVKTPAGNNFLENVVKLSPEIIGKLGVIPGSTNQDSDNKSSVDKPEVDPLMVRLSGYDGGFQQKLYPVEEVNLYGYTFYTGKVDDTGSVAVGSQKKIIAADLLRFLGYPKSLTKYLAIVDGNVLTMWDQNAYIHLPWLRVQSISSPRAEGEKILGVYLFGGGFPDDEYIKGFPDSKNNGGVIILKNAFGDLPNLTHELGHQIGQHMTDQEWAKYYKLRGIPSDTKRDLSDWNLSPTEDFAEVYKSTNAQGTSSDWLVRTRGGKQADSVTKQFVRDVVLRLSSI